MARETVLIGRRYRGPLTSANGGYTAGILARALGGAAEVTLRRPPPLETPLTLEGDGERVVLLDGPVLVAEARPCDPLVDVPRVPTISEVLLLGEDRPAGWGTAAFGECFSCGIRPEGDGLDIHPAPFDGIVASAWVAREVSTEVVWAAIDCSGAYAVGGPGRGEPVLARMTARVDRLPREGEQCLVVGWPLEEDGRKLHAGTALLDADGAVLARSRQLWIVPRDVSVAA